MATFISSPIDYWIVVSRFNYGEAVNFSFVDWFPFGEVKCKWYEFINRVVLLPHEELLCNEPMNLAMTRFSEERRHSSLSMEPAGKVFLKVAFVKLIRLQHQMIWSLKKLGAQASISLGHMSTYCWCLCKCLCYVAYYLRMLFSSNVPQSWYVLPSDLLYFVLQEVIIMFTRTYFVVCANPYLLRLIFKCTVREIRECKCGSMTVFVREDFMKKVFVAQIFE